jgi:hypothetical protein
VWINERKRIEVVLRKRAVAASALRASVRRRTTLPPTAPSSNWHRGQPIHMASCPVCTLASAFSPYRLYTSQSQPLSFAVIRAAGNEGYMAREQSRVLYIWAPTSTSGLDSLAHDMCQRPTELLLVTSDVKPSRQSPSEARPPERGRLSTAVPC